MTRVWRAAIVAATAAPVLTLGVVLGAARAPVCPQVADAVHGDLRVHELTSRVFANTRRLRVLVPPGYDAPANRQRRYPALYLNDGQNLFDARTSTFTGFEWEVDETIARLTAAGELPPIVVVGIDHAGRRERAHEYLPWPDAYLDPPEPHPAGARYPAFLVEEVLPFVEREYRVMSDATHRAIGGSSYGALAALYAAVVRPGVFGQILLESPSLYVAEGRMFGALAGGGPAVHIRVYLGVGTNELGRETCTNDEDGGEAVGDMLRLASALRARGVSDANLRVIVEPCATHDERAWARRLPGALRFLYQH